MTVGVRRTCFRLLGIAMTWLMAVATAAAQPTEAPDTSKARVRFGPLALNPIIELTNLGVDTNVFNEIEGEERSDFTITVTPKAEAWLKIGRAWLIFNIAEALVWYQTYSSERTANTSLTLGVAVPLNRLAFGVDGSYVNARDRPGFEIDARVRHTDTNLRGIVEYRALAKTHIGVRGGTQDYEYDDDATFEGAALRRELNRVTTSGAITLRYELTPLTSLTLEGGRSQDRFEFSPLRDSDSTTANFGVKFDPFALIKGTARIGYRDFKPIDSSLPGYSGSTLSADLTYTFQGSTRIGFTAGRDIQYSYDINEPYYLQTGFNFSLAQQIYGPLDAVVRFG